MNLLDCHLIPEFSLKDVTLTTMIIKQGQKLTKSTVDYEAEFGRGNRISATILY